MSRLFHVRRSESSAITRFSPFGYNPSCLNLLQTAFNAAGEKAA